MWTIWADLLVFIWFLVYGNIKISISKSPKNVWKSRSKVGGGGKDVYSARNLGYQKINDIKMVLYLMINKLILTAKN